MGYGQQWPCVPYIQQMHMQLQEQAKRIQDLEGSLKSLQAEVQVWKGKKQIHIDKIEYKFDQLKVEKLDGTLNIGFTPGAIDQLAVNGQSDSIQDDSTGANHDTDDSEEPYPTLPILGMREEMGKELQGYVEEQVPKQVDQLQKQNGLLLDDWHQKMITEDLKKQVDDRMNFYLQQMGQGATVDQLSSIKDSVLFRTKNDIRTAIAQYFDKIPKKSGGAS
jgi:spore germination protein PC